MNKFSGSLRWYLAFLCIFVSLSRNECSLKKNCSFIRTLIDRSCKEPEIKNGISVNVGKEKCFSKWRYHTMVIEGCRPMRIKSKDCLGRCNSVWFPGTEIGRLGCIGCFPAEYILSPVTFDCPGRKPNTFTRNIKIVTKCKCQSFKCFPLVKLPNKDKKILIQGRAIDSWVET